jgi:hypothetical protein
VPYFYVSMLILLINLMLMLFKYCSHVRVTFRLSTSDASTRDRHVSDALQNIESEVANYIDEGWLLFSASAMSMKYGSMKICDINNCECMLMISVCCRWFPRNYL